MTRYGYARVSTREQNPASQYDALKLYTARHIEVVASWPGFPSWTPVHYEDR